jgi:hypothetical protein
MDRAELDLRRMHSGNDERAKIRLTEKVKAAG